MTDRPILFSAPMIRALLGGRKTQTRRLIKDRGDLPQFCGGRYDAKDDHELWGWEDHDRGEWITLDQWRKYRFVPFIPGDRLWVRETCRAWEVENTGEDVVQFLADETSQLIQNTPEAAESWGAMYHYGARGPKNRVGQTVPSIHMPRWASRLTLPVTDVRVERLQDITRGDAMAEGCPFANMADGPNPCDWFRDQWNATSGPDAWAANPWIVALTFTVHRCNIDQMNETPT